MTQITPIDGAQLLDPAAVLASSERRSLALSDLRVDPALACRRALDPRRIRLMTEAHRSGAKLEPLVVAILDDTITLVDGHHRYHALLAAGEGRTAAFLLTDVHSRQEARWLAFWLHWKAAKPLSQRERREGFKAYVAADKHLATRFGRVKQYRTMAAELGLAHTTLWRWVKEDFPSIAARLSREPGSDRESRPPTPNAERQAREALQHHANQIALIARGQTRLQADAKDALMAALRRLGDERPAAAILEASRDGYDF
jgi:hypothetical protein